ncbi:hypothetical protein COOONC_16862 [Cooperia oncophora]
MEKETGRMTRSRTRNMMDATPPSKLNSREPKEPRRRTRVIKKKPLLDNDTDDDLAESALSPLIKKKPLQEDDSKDLLETTGNDTAEFTEPHVLFCFQDSKGTYQNGASFVEILEIDTASERVDTSLATQSVSCEDNVVGELGDCEIPCAPDFETPVCANSSSAEDLRAMVNDDIACSK